MFLTKCRKIEGNGAEIAFNQAWQGLENLLTNLNTAVSFIIGLIASVTFCNKSTVFQTEKGSEKPLLSLML